MPRRDESYERVEVADRGAWRRWLEANHAGAPGAWLVSYKKASGKSTISYDESVEEALCFGWIDSRPGKVDDERSMLLFTPRKPRSPWSRPNKRRIERLLDSGLMTPAGLTKIEAAKRDGSWTLYDAVEDLIVPADLRAALDADPDARDNFDAFGISVKKPLLWWVISAKKPETRSTRIETIVRAAREKRNPLAYPRPK
jgi:uncharacterized protein YdeI (YjbR/CyaY-like superfamily)